MNVNFARGVDINIKKIYTFLDFCFEWTSSMFKVELNVFGQHVLIML